MGAGRWRVGSAIPSVRIVARVPRRQVPLRGQASDPNVDASERGRYPQGPVRPALPEVTASEVALYPRLLRRGQRVLGPLGRR